MSIKDDITVLFGSGIDLAGKKAETIKLQADLTKTTAAIEAAYAALGRAVLQGEAPNSTFLSAYESKVNSVIELEKRAAEIGSRIEELDRAASAPKQSAPYATMAPTGACPSCGAMVAVSSPYCPMCGNNLQTLKQRYVWCPSCNAYFEEGTAFCINCGSRLQQLPVAPERVTERPVDTAVPVEPVNPEPAPSVCPGCGNPVEPGDVFCGVCGTRLNA